MPRPDVYNRNHASAWELYADELEANLDAPRMTEEEMTERVVQLYVDHLKSNPDWREGLDTDETPATSDHWAAYRAKYHHCHEGGGISYITREALSINEAGTPVNFHINWGKRKGIYLYLFGLRLYWFKKQRA